MRVLNKNTISQEIEYINKVLRGKKRGFKKVALEDYNKADTELLEELKALGYVKVKNQIIRTDDITKSNIEVIEPSRYVENTVTDHRDKTLSNVDTNKLNILLDNLEELLKLVPKYNSCIYRSNNNKVISIRVDEGLYNELKHRALRDNTTATELFNKALEEYLGKY